MKRSTASKAGATAPSNGGPKGRRFRLGAGVAAIFAAGIGVGAVFGGWMAGQDVPATQVSLAPPPPPLSVTVRAYRPPLRAAPSLPATPTRPPPAPPAAAPLAAAPPIDRENVAAPAINPAPPIQLGSARRDTWLANAVPSPAPDGRPMIAVVMDDLGIDQARTRRVLALPAPLTLAFIPYGRNLRRLSGAGRAAGHELIVHVNMEPKDRGVDAGPKALLTSLTNDEIRSRLRWALSRFDGYTGVSNHMGSRFTEWPDGVEVVLRELRGRGLLFLDSVTSEKSVAAALARAHGMAYARRDVFLDNDRRASKIALRLAETERIARRRGYAIAIGHPHDATLLALERWLPEVEKRGFLLVPLSAIVRHRGGEG